MNSSCICITIGAAGVDCVWSKHRNSNFRFISQTDVHVLVKQSPWLLMNFAFFLFRSTECNANRFFFSIQSRLVSTDNSYLPIASSNQKDVCVFSFFSKHFHKYRNYHCGTLLSLHCKFSVFSCISVWFKRKISIANFCLQSSSEFLKSNHSA